MSESFEAFVGRVPSFHELPPTDKIVHAAWYLHERAGKSVVTTSDINSCFDQIHAVPPHTSVYLKRLAERKPPLFLRSKSGFRLEGKLRTEMRSRYAGPSATVVVSSLLSQLIDKIGSDAEKTFLIETLNCYSVGAFRAAIVMAWNLAYSHFERWVISSPDRVQKFNQSYQIKFPKRTDVLTDHENFAEFKEFDAIETAAHAKLFSKNVSDLFKEKLKRRNAAAHPSLITISQAQADDVITDLVNNVVAKLG